MSKQRVLAEADLGLLRGASRSWRRRIVSYAGSLREALLARPATVPLFPTAPMTGPVALEVGEHLLRTLGGAGLEPDDAARAVWVLIVYVLGSVALDVAETDGRAPLSPEMARIGARLERFRALDAPGFPRTVAAASVMAAWISTEQFRWGLERILDGSPPPRVRQRGCADSGVGSFGRRSSPVRRPETRIAHPGAAWPGRTTCVSCVCAPCTRPRRNPSRKATPSTLSGGCRSTPPGSPRGSMCSASSKR